MTYTKRKEKNENSLLVNFWNEFLFAREFEYETPLLPDEVVTALLEMEQREYRPSTLGFSPKLKHRVVIERHNDKASDFKVHLGYDIKGALSMQYAEGSMLVEADSGLIIIKGRTRFSAMHYIITLLPFVFQLVMQSLLQTPAFTVWITFGVIILYWWMMYRERNALADRIDNVIMHTKSEHSLMGLEMIEDDGSMELEVTDMQSRTSRG